MNDLPHEGNGGHLESAESALEAGRLDVALSTLLELLSESPHDPQGRLLLAHIYYLSGCVELASEEVSRLQERFPEKESLQRLMQALDPSTQSVVQEPEKVAEKVETPPAQKKEKKKEDDVVAEADFDFDDIDLLED
jgi:predicted Zn-dependent protease